ncbi:MAG: PLDc N-terminal domain-containing protein, partial [Bacteroides sp.]
MVSNLLILPHLFTSTLLFIVEWHLAAGVLVSLFYILTILTTVIVVILDKRDPTKAMLWVVVLVMLPVAGLLVYLFFGQNLRRKHIFKRKKRVDNSLLNEETLPSCISYADAQSELQSITANRHVAQLLLNNSLAPVIGGNSVALFHEGQS